MLYHDVTVGATGDVLSRRQHRSEDVEPAAAHARCMSLLGAAQ